MILIEAEVWKGKKRKKKVGWGTIFSMRPLDGSIDLFAIGRRLDFSGVGARWKKIKIVRLRGSGVGVTLRWFDSADSEAFHIICHRYFRPGRSIHSPAFSRNESPITKVTSRERALNADYRFPSSFLGSSPESIFVPRVKLRWTSWHLLVPSNIFILETGINVTVVVYSVKIPFVKELLLYLVLYRWA